MTAREALTLHAWLRADERVLRLEMRAINSGEWRPGISGELLAKDPELSRLRRRAARLWRRLPWTIRQAVLPPPAR